jgi:TonB family protein
LVFANPILPPVNFARISTILLLGAAPYGILEAQSFAGVVRDSTTGSAAANLWVTLRPASEARVESEGRTDSLGRFTLPALHSLYRVTFSLPNGVRRSIDSVTAPAAGTPREFWLPVSAAEREHMYFDFQVDRVASPRRQVAPRYPSFVSTGRLEGDVLIQIAVDSTGVPAPGTFVVLRSPGPEFTSAVFAALQEWTFAPAMRKGRAVRQLVQIPFNFRQ